MMQGRHAEADARYDAALTAARRAGDKELEGTLLLHQGLLARRMDQYPRATKLYQQALSRFQEMNDDANIMQTCNLLGVVDYNQGRLTEARTWYERSREIAQGLGAISALATAAQNIGIVRQEEGEAAREQGREPEARRCFEEARQSLQESLRLKQQIGREPAEAMAWGQLAQVHLLLGDLDEAEHHAQKAREIRERLGLKEVHRDYSTLSDIARARGNGAEAAKWQRRRDTALEELQRRAQGPGGPPPQLAEAVQQLAMACAHAAVEGVDLGPAEESILAQLDGLPAPLSDLASFLRGLAAGDMPAVPGSLPQGLGGFLTQLLDSVQEARR